MTRKQRICLALALVLAFAAVVALVWKKKEPEQIVTLRSGEQYRFAGATYGTQHVQPVAFGVRLVNHVPPPFTNLVQRITGRKFTPIATLSTPEPVLVVWFVKSGGSNPGIAIGGGWGNVNAILADQDDVVSGSQNVVRLPANGPRPLITFQVSLAPRRSRDLQLHLFDTRGFPGDPYKELGEWRVRNPLFGRFPQWQSDPLTAVKKAGDLGVRLAEFRVCTTNAAAATTMTPTNPPTAAVRDSPQTFFKLKINAAKGTNDEWVVRRAELSDATGNRINSAAYEMTRSRETGEYFVNAALWPGEAAWRLKLELSLAPTTVSHAISIGTTNNPQFLTIFTNSAGKVYTWYGGDAAGTESAMAMTRRELGILGYLTNADEELVTFKNITVPSLGSAGAWQTNQVHGVPFLLRFDNFKGFNSYGTWLRVEMPVIPDGLGVDYLLATTPAGEILSPSRSLSRSPINAGKGFHWDINVTTPRSGASVSNTVEATFVVVKTRTVEFFVKPPKAE